MLFSTLTTFCSHHGESFLDHIMDFWVQLLFSMIFPAIIVFDLWLVSKKKMTISMTIWVLNRLHPTILAAGVLVGVGICYLLQASWVAVMIAAASMGHLCFTSEATEEDVDDFENKWFDETPKT